MIFYILQSKKFNFMFTLNAGKTPAKRLQNASTHFSFLSRETLAKRGDL